MYANVTCIPSIYIRRNLPTNSYFPVNSLTQDP